MNCLTPDKYRLRLDRKISNRECIVEIRRRQLTINVSDYLQQCQITSIKTKKSKIGLAFANDKGGYEIRIPNSRRHTNEKYYYGERAISTFPAHPKAENITAFAFPNFWDFLTYVHIYGKSKSDDMTVYNGLITEAGNYMLSKHPRQALHCHENTAEGKETDVALSDILQPSGIIYGAVNHIYEGYKDLSGWRQENPHVVVRKLEAAPQGGPAMRARPKYS